MSDEGEGLHDGNDDGDDGSDAYNYDEDDVDGQYGIYEDDEPYYRADDDQPEQVKSSYFIMCNNSSASVSLEVKNSRTITSHPKLSLNNKKKDIRTLIQNLKRCIGLVDHEELTPGCILKYFVYGSSWMDDFRKRVTASKVRDFREHEVLAFLEFVCLCHYYGKSPTALCDPRAAGTVVQPLMNVNRFLNVLSCLDEDRNHLSAGAHRSSSVWSSSEDSLKH